MKDTESTISPARLEAFSDGVLAIIITIMVLEIHSPEGHSLSDWKQSISLLLAYLFSFIMIAIYWNNHHHLLRATKNITAIVMWANMALLFFLSLIPVTTAWVGANENYKHSWPIALYATVCLFAGLSFYALTLAILKADKTNIKIANLNKSYKGIVSPILYILAICLAFINPYVAIAIMLSTAALWFIPDKRLTN